MSRFFALTAVAIMSAAALSGCGEREQTASYEDGKYRGKPDDRPWKASGERASWERQIRARGDAQNENRRIGH